MAQDASNAREGSADYLPETVLLGGNASRKSLENNGRWRDGPTKKDLHGATWQRASRTTCREQVATMGVIKA